MGLTLVTGPANSAKAALVLERYRAALARAAILVVPRAADVEHYRRELAEDGAVLGVAVEPFGGLMRELAQRAGILARPIEEPARERILAAVVGDADLELLAPAAAAPGFVRALARFVAELEARRVQPGRLRAALRAWAAPQTRRGRYGEELAGLYAGYRRALERLGLLDAELHAVAALDALRLAPDRWGRTPVFCYGFDDLEPLQLDAIETLAHRVGAPVTLSLPGEPGRVALAGRGATLETLRGGADEVIVQGPLDTHYEDATLHHLERALFEDAPARVAPGDAVRLLEGGDERAEAELIAAEIDALILAGCSPRDIAVVPRRGGAGVGVLVTQALRARGTPAVAARREPFADTALGGALVALLRAALRGGDAADLVRWLRAPGLLTATAFVDRFEALLLDRAIGDLASARALWEAEHWPLDALDRLRDARRGLALIDRVERELDGLFGAPVRRSAALVEPWQAAILGAGRRTLAALRELARTAPALAPDAEVLIAALEDTVVELAPPPDADAVLVCDALALRARRVRALFIAGVQEGIFPAPERDEAFLTTADRVEIARASGLVLGAPVDALAAERYLFYALCSRPTAALRVSWHDTVGDDAPALRSLFIDDLEDCFDAVLHDGRAVRGAGTVAWGPAGSAPPELEALERALRGPRRRGPVIAPLEAPERLALLRGHDPHSPSALEAWLSCPVAWFVARALGARALGPDGVPLARGAVAHEVLRSVFVTLRERTGSARLHAGNLPVALELLREALDSAGRPLAPSGPIDRAEQRRLRSDLERYLRFAAETFSAHEPREFELAFGLDGDPHPPVALAGGALELCGRIDRVDIDERARSAVVYDYKTSAAVDPVARWDGGRRLQPALYMLAVEQLLGVEAVAGLYQPLRSADLRPRGAAVADADPGLPVLDNDRVAPADFRALLAARVAVAVGAAGELARGALAPRPQSCIPGGGCRFPAVCRCEGR